MGNKPALGYLEDGLYELSVGNNLHSLTSHFFSVMIILLWVGLSDIVSNIVKLLGYIRLHDM